VGIQIWAAGGQGQGRLPLRARALGRLNPPILLSFRFFG
jgi:hypothetical protein